MNDRLIIGIAGGSGSGKTTLTQRLVEHFGDRLCVVTHDNYYRAHNDLSYEERAQLNYDCPDAFENELFVEQLALLRQGRSVNCPVYDYTVHNRSDKTILLSPRPIILVEGILIFADESLREQMDIRVFVDTDADVRLARRVLRDSEERARSVRSIVDQWQNTVKPMHELYVEPSKKHAHVIIPEGGHNTVALDMIVDRLERHLKK
jgi:uridine kinase